MGNNQHQQGKSSSMEIIDWNEVSINCCDDEGNVYSLTNSSSSTDSTSPPPVVKLWNRIDLLASEVGYDTYYLCNIRKQQKFEVDLLQEGYTKKEIKEFDDQSSTKPPTTTTQTTENTENTQNVTGSSTTPVNRHPLWGNNSKKICLRLKELFTEQELEPLMLKINKLNFNSLEKEYPKQYRNCKRVLVKSKPMADVIWNRIKPMLKVSDWKDLRPYGFDTEGLWKPIGINECLRISKYEKNGFFKPHMDGQFVVDDNRKSILTVLIYLSGETFGGGGGSTDYYHCIDKKDSTLQLRKVLSTPCIAGDCILFNHEIYHSGEPVAYGEKYVLRTEVIFQRVDSTSNVSRSLNYQASDDYGKIRNLIEESERLEKEGQVEKSTQIYLEAQHLQMNLPAKVKSSRATSFLEQSLPSEVLSLIFSYLPAYEVCKTILHLNRNLNADARDQYTWKQRYRYEWSANRSNTTGGGGFDYNSTIMKMEEELICNDDTTDWFQLFVTRKNLDKDFCTLIVDPGSNYFRYALKSSEEMKVEVSYSGVGRHSHYFMPGRGLLDLLTGESAKKYKDMIDTVDLFEDGNVNVFVLACFIEQSARNSLKVNVTKHPLLLAKPISLTGEEEEHLKDILFGLGVPAIQIEYSYSLMALYYGMSNCTIINLLPNHVDVVVVENGQPVIDSAYHSPFLNSARMLEDYYYGLDWPSQFMKKAIVKNDDENDEIDVNDVSSSSDKQYQVGEAFYGTLIECIKAAKLQDKPSNIIVRGEMSKVPGLVKRLSRELSVEQLLTQVKITHDPANCTWDVLLGGKILSNLSDFKQKCQHSAHYENTCSAKPMGTLDTLFKQLK